METEPTDKVVHLLNGITGHAVISAYCRAAMQSAGSAGWDSNVNYWGKVGIRKHRPWTTLTRDIQQVTCKRCLTAFARAGEE